MNNRKTAQALLDALQQGDLDRARTNLAERFRFSGSAVPGPMDAEAWLGMCASLKTAFPDLDYRFQIVDEHGEAMVLTSRWSGTHTGDLDLTGAMDLGVIPATHKSFAAGPQLSEISVEPGGVSAWAEEPANGAGLMAILQQLDVYIADVIVPRRIR
jgi:hypothetical protein